MRGRPLQVESGDALCHNEVIKLFDWYPRCFLVVRRRGEDTSAPSVLRYPSQAHSSALATARAQGSNSSMDTDAAAWERQTVQEEMAKHGVWSARAGWLDQMEGKLELGA